MMLLITAILGYFVLGRVEERVRTHTEEEYWAGWKKFLAMEDAKARHNSYSSKAEHDMRFEIFKDNMEKIKEHNSGDHSWFMKITQFTDMKPKEFKDYVACGNLNHKPSEHVFEAPRDYHKTAVDSIDWVTKGAVTPVKNQASCGSCWAFSTTGALEGRTFCSTGVLQSLSEQELVDCSKQNAGCNGGLMDYAFAFVKTNGGLCSETDYPYIARKHFLCKDSTCTKYDKNTGYVDVAQASASLEAAVAQGPVAIAIEADESNFQNYGGGVLTAACGTSLDHGVLAVGYGTDGADNYWKVKNSWGADWGESGYIRLCKDCGANNGAGQCGILTSASYPTV